MNEPVMIPGAHNPISIDRDGFGIPHIRAASERDVWFGMGFAAAQDRLWQMEYDRRRAVGRWAEVAGRAALPADRLARRMRITEAAQRDVAAMSDETQAMFTAYADGVNGYLQSGQPLPPEYGLTGIRPEPWLPWHSVASFKIRHVLMGTWQTKLASAILLARSGPETFQQLASQPPIGSIVALPPGRRIEQLYEQAGEEIAAAARELGFLAELEAGSNAWAVHGSRTTTGLPVLCNDSHRMLDVPNVYWQVQVSCPEFAVIGGAFPGIPGFPHFGHNGAVGWAITHGQADYQDLYIEIFEGDRYRTPEGWVPAEHREETIAVREGEAEIVHTWITRHGPVVHGDPASGRALALRYTALDGPNRGFEVLRPMLRSQTVEALFATQEEWVDPVNNLVAADTAGSIGYLTRGRLPVRSSQAHRQLPTPGWTGEHEWIGAVPFARMPRAINPEAGFIATSNQRIVAEDDIYIGHFFADPFRAERVAERLMAMPRMAPDEIADIQGDTTAIPARWVARWMGDLGPFEGEAEQARSLLAGWDGNLRPESGPALLYGAFRRTLAQALFQPLLGEATWAWLQAASLPATVNLVRRWLAHEFWSLGKEPAQPSPELLAVTPEALAAAWRLASQAGGPDPAAWRWDQHHHTAARHTLSGTFPSLAFALNPPEVGLGGDGDTVQAATYGWRLNTGFPIIGLPVYRQVLDFSALESSTFVIPGGASAVPESPHYQDQLPLWQQHRRIPMHYREEDVANATVDHQELRPA